jgi:hypothetical protein
MIAVSLFHRVSVRVALPRNVLTIIGSLPRVLYKADRQRKSR